MLRTHVLARVCATLLLCALLPLTTYGNSVPDGSSTNGGGSVPDGSGGTSSGVNYGDVVGSGINTYDTGTTYNMGGGTVSLATAILNGGTVTNGTLSASSSIDARSGSVSAQLAGTANLVKTTTGTLVLSGANTYSGSTTISEGLLQVTGSLGATIVTVQSGGMLGGTGTIGGPTTIQSGGTLVPGASPGTLTFTDGLALDAGSVLEFELGTLSDLILVTGGTLAGPESGVVTINLSDAGGAAPGTYTLIDATGATLNSIGATSFNIGSTPVGWSTSLVFDANKLQLNLSAIPEPATAVALAGGAAALVVSSRRRRRQGHASVLDRS